MIQHLIRNKDNILNSANRQRTDQLSVIYNRISIIQLQGNLLGRLKIDNIIILVSIWVTLSLNPPWFTVLSDLNPTKRTSEELIIWSGTVRPHQRLIRGSRLPVLPIKFQQVMRDVLTQIQIIHACKYADVQIVGQAYEVTVQVIKLFF